MKRQPTNPAFYEVEVAPGLEPVVYQELLQQLGSSMRLQQPLETLLNSGVIPLRYPGDAGRLIRLATVFNVYLVIGYKIPRPKTLLAQEHFDHLITTIQPVINRSPHLHYQSFGLSAAGSDSSVLQELCDRLAARLGLVFATEEVDLQLRLRPARLHQDGWEVLIRLTPRPLSVRKWRVADMKGALNAAMARCMIMLTQPKPTDKFLNLTCGSGTLLVERLMAAPVRRAIGCDTDPAALHYAQANLTAANFQSVVELQGWDARATNLPDASIDAICADLPFGIAVGGHIDNVELYPQLLREAARVAKPKSRFVLMTQEVTLLEGLLAQSNDWKLLECLKITLRGLHPRLYVLQRKST